MTCYRFDLVNSRWSISPIGAGTAPSAAYNDLLTDTLYRVNSTSIIPVGTGTVVTGRWRSKRFILQDFAGYGWLRVNGNLIAGVVARLYADGVLFYTTPTLLTPDPVRLPGGRAKRWELEIESADRVTLLMVATTTAELLP